MGLGGGEGPAGVGIQEATTEGKEVSESDVSSVRLKVVEENRAQLPEVLMQKALYVAEVWVRGLGMRDRYRGFLRWKRKAKKANPEFKKKKKKKKKKGVTGVKECAIKHNDQEQLERDEWWVIWEWWEEQVGDAGARQFFKDRTLRRVMVHWSMRVAVTQQRRI